jgi:hypothetical protein
MAAIIAASDVTAAEARSPETGEGEIQREGESLME